MAFIEKAGDILSQVLKKTVEDPDKVGKGLELLVRGATLPDPDDSTGDFRATGRALGRFRQEQRKRDQEDKRFNEKELDIGSDRNTKTMLERMEGFSDLSEQGKKEFFKDMSDKKKLTNSERRRRGLPTLGTGKKSGGKVYSRGSRKAKYNG